MDTAITLFFNGSDNLYLNGVAMLATKAWMWIPFYIALLYVLVREHNFRQLMFIIGGLLLCVLIADQVASGICKPLVARLRPSHEPSLHEVIDVVEGYRSGSYGFFSSHASNTASIAVYLALFFRKRLTVVTLAAWCLLNCWTRLYLGVHYFGDILVGLLFGALVGATLYYVVRHRFLRDEELHYSASRLSVITSVFLLTLVVITLPIKLFF